MSKDYPGAFAALRAILAQHREGMSVLADTETNYTLVSPAIGPNGKPLWFGAVTSKKSAVTYHFMPLYYNPKLVASLSPALESRRSGKTCFQFQQPEPEVFEDLAELTRVGQEQWRRAGFLDRGPIPPERFTAAFRAAGGDPKTLAAKRRKALAARRDGTRRRET
jgi:hypothetical protein